jgi:hypothetical protein
MKAAVQPKSQVYLLQNSCLQGVKFNMECVTYFLKTAVHAVSNEYLSDLYIDSLMLHA